jgi:riboflavin transporter FmnP
MTGITRDVMTMGVSGRDTVRLVGTAILAAMVIVFDYTLKYSGLKIPFPWMPFLKFDFTGVPIMISLFMFGLPSAVSTSLAALLGIIARSGELVGATSKALAELSTALGIAAGLRLTGDRASKTPSQR